MEAVENRPKDSVQETPQIVATKSSEVVLHIDIHPIEPKFGLSITNFFIVNNFYLLKVRGSEKNCSVFQSLCNSSAAKTEVIAHESASALNSTTGLDSAPENVEKTDISDEQNGSSETTLRVRDDPRYSKYFKMLKMVTYLSIGIIHIK